MQQRLKHLAAFLALTSTQGLAGDDIPTLGEVLVTAPADVAPPPEPYTLGPKEIAPQRARTSDTANLLKDVPGVSAYGAGGVSSLPVIRGLADDRLRTKVDGMDLIASCPNHMNPALSYIDPTAVEKMQVYSGVTPVSVGGDSIGGSILVQSAPPAFANRGEQITKGEAGTFFRSNGNNWGGNLSGTYATDSLSLNYTGSYAQSDNYKAGGKFKDYNFTGRGGHTVPQDEVGSSAYEALNQSASFAWKNENHLVDFTAGRQHIPYERFPNQRMDMTDNLSNQFNLGYSGDQGWGTLNARAYYDHTEHAMNFGADKRYWYGPGSGGPTAINATPCSPISPTCAAGMPMDTDGKTGGFTLNTEIPLGDTERVRVGGEFQNYRLNDWWSPSGAGMWPYTFLNINDGQRNRYALFGEWETTKDRWMHILGVRLEALAMDTGRVHGYNTDNYPTVPVGMSMGNQTRDAALFNNADRSKTDLNWDFSWIGRFTPEITQTYEIGLAQKTRSPNLYERYTWSTWQMAAFMNNQVGDGNGYVGNLDLNPEVARTLSLTADWHDAKQEQWGVRVTPYYSFIHDYVDAVQWDSNTNAPPVVPVVDNFTTLKYFNQSARIYGVDLSANHVLADNTGYGDFWLSGVASYTRGKNHDTKDNLYNIMPLNARVAITQELGAWSNTLEGVFVADKDKVSAVRNEMKTGAFGLVNLQSRYQQKTWSLEAGIQNLLDRFYDLPLGGAYLGQGTTMTIPPYPNQPQWGTPVPGPGRSFYAAVAMKF